MNRSKRSAFLTGLLLSFAVSSAVFTVSYRQDHARALESTRMVWGHLLYAVRLRDDMAIIDWAKDLEQFESIRYFQAMDGSKTIAEGGNREYLSSRPVQMIQYQFPSRWILHLESHREGLQNWTLDLVYGTFPGPFYGALGAFVWGVVLVLIPLGFMGRGPAPVPDPIVTFPHGPASQRIPELKPGPNTAWDPNRPSLFLDRNYVIQHVTPSAADLFLKTPIELQNGHLIDLSPEPHLLAAIEKGEEVQLLHPFAPTPGLTVFLKPDHNGILLIFQTSSSSETMEKH